MRYIALLLMCFTDYILAHVDEIWSLDDGNIQNLVFFGSIGLRFALFMSYTLIVGFKVYTPNRWQLIGFSIYGLFALTEYFIKLIPFKP